MKYLPVILSLVLCCHICTAHPSWGIVVTDNDDIYFTDVMHYTDGGLCKIDAGTYNMTVIQDDMHAHSLFADNNGNMWAGIDIWREGSIMGEGHHYLVKYNIARQTLDTVLFTDDEDRFFGNNIAVDDAGNAYFTIHNRIFKYDTEGATTLLFTHEFERINTFTVDRQGNFWIADKEKDNGTLYKWNEDKGLTAYAKNLLPEQPQDPIFDEARHQIFYAIGFDEAGTPLLCDNTTRKLRRITAQGAQIVYSSDDNWHPIGVYYHNKEYYVMESGWKHTHKGPRIMILDSGFNKIKLLNINATNRTVSVNNYDTNANDKDKNTRNGLPVYLLPLFIVGILIGTFRKKLFSTNK